MFDIDHIFTYHAPDKSQQMKYENLRHAAKQFAQAVVAYCPPSADQGAAIRLIREALMTANASIALGGRLTLPRGEAPPYRDP